MSTTIKYQDSGIASSNSTLAKLLWKNRLVFWDVALLSLIESIIFTAQFFVIGYAIDQLIKVSYKGIVILIALYLAKMIIAFIKQLRHTKAYEEIYTILLVENITQPLEEGADPKSVAGRSHAIYQISDFVRNDMLSLFESSTRLILILISLFIFNKTIFLFALLFSVIVGIIYRLRKNDTQAVTKDLSHAIFDEQEIIYQKDIDSIYKQHELIEQKNSKLSSILGLNSLVVEVLSLVFLVASLVILVQQQKAEAVGSFFMLSYYVMAFSGFMFAIPAIYQRFVSFNTLTKLIKNY